MKKATYFIVYLAALVIGILLLIGNQAPMEETIPASMRGIVIASGIVFIFGGAVNLVYSMRPKYDAEGVMVSRPWYLTVMAIAALFWGILLVCLSGSFTYNFAVTSGVSLILAGLASVMWIVGARRPYGAAGWWYIAPLCTIGAGIIDITLINDYANLAQSSSTAAILSGILLLCLGVNGFISLNSRKRVEESVIESVNKIHDKDKR